MAKKSKHRPVSKKELLKACKEMSTAQKSTEGASWTCLLIIFNWILHKMDNWEQEKLGEYNRLFHELLTEIQSNNESFETLSEELYQYADFKVDFIPGEFTKPRNIMEKIRQDIEKCGDQINQQSALYTTMNFIILKRHFNYSAEHLSSNRDAILAKISEEGETHSILKLRDQLCDEAGIYVALPTESEEDFENDCCG